MSGTKIFCPKCEYAPRPFDVWICTGACRTVWNTFETGGQCPACHKQWRETCCPACSRWSPHEDWYHEEVWDAAKEHELEEAGAELVEVG